MSESRISADSADFADYAIAHVNFTFMSELRFLFSVFRIPISDLEKREDQTNAHEYTFNYE